MAVPSRAGRPNSANAASVQSAVPVTRFSSQAPIRPSRWICSSRAVSWSTSPASRQVRTIPSKNRRDPDVGDGPRHLSRRGAQDRARNVLGVPGGQGADRVRQQAARGRGHWVGLQQRAPGDLGGAPPARVPEGLPGVVDPEVGNVAVAVPQRGSDQHGLEQAVEQAGKRRARAHDREVAVLDPRAQQVRARLGQVADLVAQRVREAVPGQRPADLHHAQQHRARGRGGPAPPAPRRAIARPAAVYPAAPGTLPGQLPRPFRNRATTGRGHRARPAAPGSPSAAGYGASGSPPPPRARPPRAGPGRHPRRSPTARRRTRREAPAPDPGRRPRSRFRRPPVPQPPRPAGSAPPRLRQAVAHPLHAGPAGARVAAQDRPGPGPGDGRTGSWPMIAAAISATGVPASAASAVSWLAASVGGTAQPFHERALGHVDDRTGRRAGARPVQLLPLAVDDRSQAQDVLAAVRHRSPTFLLPR